MIDKKIYYFVKFRTKSPLSIGSGLEELTDHDILKDADGKPFIPATSLAGVMLHYLERDEKEIFNPKKNNEKILSPYFISDAILTKNTGTSIRDGIKVGEDNIVVDGAKYDIEILETGSEFSFRIELTIREKAKEEKMKNIVDKILFNLNAGNILLGMKSKRGFGKVEIIDCYKKVFTKENLEDLLNFSKFDYKQYEKYEINTKIENTKFDTIEIGLKQLGGLSIRSYSAKAGDVDFKLLTSNKKPVVPGSSWAGIIRKQVNYYNDILAKQGYEYDIDKWFGYVYEEETKASSIIIEESTIENSKQFILKRNKIDRFSGGSAESALYNEEAVFNGELSLKIKINKNIGTEKNTYIIGLISLVIKDIANGLLAVGGQTAIGRGILEVKSIKIDDEEKEINDLDNYILKMYDIAKAGGSDK